MAQELGSSEESNKQNNQVVIPITQLASPNPNIQ